MAKTTRKAGAAGMAASRAPGGFNSGNLNELYAVSRYLDRDTETTLGLRLPFLVYFKDPALRKDMAGDAMDPDFNVVWEPGLGDGPTSARFAVVDYDSTAGVLAAPARWDAKTRRFVGPDGAVLDAGQEGTPQFHQVSTWAVLQNTLDFYESGWGLGRRILWGFDGNRLIVVPHAGYGENAYYDRGSKSLQFYYFDDEEGSRVFTCLSSDIVNHEFGHALLDGIRPHYIEAVSPETAAFHEFIGDLNALLMAFRNNSFRKVIAERTSGDLAKDDLLSSLAAEFGAAVNGVPYLRTAQNGHKMGEFRDSLRPHDMSQVLTGAMFDILAGLARSYLAKPRAAGGGDDSPRKTPAQALAFASTRMQYTAIQPLDLLPPVEVTFRDYALAVLRADEIANPTDPDGYRAMMIDVFVTREILGKDEAERLKRPRHVFQRLRTRVFHDPAAIAISRAEAYRFLDDNRPDLFIPHGADIVVADVFTAEKLTREARRLPKQIILQYVWREELVLAGARFGRFDGETTSFLCGATLVLDEEGNVLAWSRKPGAQPLGTKPDEIAEQQAGERRRAVYLEHLAQRIATGMVGETLGGAAGLVAESVPALTSQTVDGMLRFELSPHLSLNGDHDGCEAGGGRKWHLSF